METSQLKRIIEAALLASAHPLSLPQISGLFDEFSMPSHDDLAKAVEELQADAAERGIELVEVASGFRYQVRQDVHPFVSRLWAERQTRYSRALLETLSLIAYRQPITRGEIEQVRGVAVNSNIIKALEEREWIRVVGHRDVPGKPALFGTTKVFLDYFGLKRLDELPPLSELKDIGELEPQLQFEGTPAPIAAGVADGEAGDAGTDAEPANESDAQAGDTASQADEADAGENEATGDDASSDADVESGEGEATAEAAATDAEETADDNNETIDAEVADLDIDENEYALQGDPDAAPGERAADENDHEQDNAVETTTVPTDDEAELAESEQHKND